MNRMNSDQYISELLQGDQIGKPDEKILDRLMYSFLFKSGKAKIRQNSLRSFLAWLFSIQSIGLKAGLASFLLLFTLVNNNFNNQPGRISNNDSILSKHVWVADSTGLNKSVDSIHIVN